MKTKALILIACASAFVGCSESDRPTAETSATNRVSRAPRSETANRPPVAMTNQMDQGLASIPVADVARNVPSAGTTEVSQTVGGLPSGDQAATEADAGIIQRIRKSFLTDTAMAALDPNIHIACTNGEVTLTGTVSSDQVKMGLSDKAKAVADVKNVNNQLEVK